MKIIEFTKKGKAISDYKISQFVDDFINNDKYNENCIPLVSTHLVIEEIRARICEGTIDYDNIRIIIDGEEWNFDRDARSYDWNNSQEVYSNILSRILKGRLKK